MYTKQHLLNDFRLLYTLHPDSLGREAPLMRSSRHANDWAYNKKWTKDKT